MPNYKLTYFNVKYRPEITRLMLVASGTDFEDCRVNDLTELKAGGKLPLGQVPIFEVDGRLIVQSRAIQRYVARELGFYGTTNDEQTEIDQVTETFGDILDSSAPWLYREKDLTKRAEIKKEFEEVKGPMLFGFLEKKLEASSSGYFVGDSLTLADFAVFNGVDIVGGHMPDLFKPFPKLLEHKAKIEGNERIAKYLATRPKTQM
ncbi:glutathione S-transferase 3-like [Diadema antillarum]|uniref:glutathione S-transferase 3-like n=1 Tax=Diadema antillarum TaxID=105358 RepID=UPI003A8975FD